MSETKRRILVVVVLLLVVLFGVGQFFAGINLNNTTNQQTDQSGQPSGSNTNPLPTQVIAYVPPAPASGTPVERGSCFADSIAAPYRADAWRCMIGNAISDPCFTMPSAVQASGTPSSLPQLLCGANPATADTSSTFVLQLTKKLPQSEMPSGTIPTNWAWVVQLNDGTICTPFTGTRPFSKTGEVATYSCNGAVSGEDLIFGDLNNSGDAWTAEVGSLSTSTATFPPSIAQSSTVPIFAVWQ
jgi:hypothetical protein